MGQRADVETVETTDDGSGTITQTRTINKSINNWAENKFYFPNKGKAIRIGWTDARREPMVFKLLTWDTFTVLVEAKDGKTVLIPKHAIAFVIEEEPRPQPEESAE